MWGIRASIRRKDSLKLKTLLAIKLFAHLALRQSRALASNSSDCPTTRLATAATLDDATRCLADQTYDLIVTDIRLGARRDGGLQVMAAAGLLAPDATILVLTAYPNDDIRHASMRLGATHFFGKPVDLSTLAAVARQAGVMTSIESAAATDP